MATISEKSEVTENYGIPIRWLSHTDEYMTSVRNKTGLVTFKTLSDKMMTTTPLLYCYILSSTEGVVKGNWWQVGSFVERGCDGPLA